jgi:hypothetical protein
MNKRTSIVLFLFLSVTFLSCKVSKTTDTINLEKNPPFKIVTATYNKWNGGQPGVNGLQIRIQLNKTHVVLDTVYFRNNRSNLKIDNSTSPSTYVGTFVLPNTQKNYILDADSKKEFGNAVPDISQKIPFQLNANEAVVSFKINNKPSYYKISNIQETTTH